MAFKVVVFCVATLLVQSISGQCGSRISYAPSCGSSSGSSRGSGSGSLSANSIAIPSNGGDFLVTSVGPISPSGISVAADIGLSGDLNVAGALPFLSAVEFQGSYDTCGSGSVCYSCGDSCGVGINNVVGSSGSSGSGCGCRA